MAASTSSAIALIAEQAKRDAAHVGTPTLAASPVRYVPKPQRTTSSLAVQPAVSASAVSRPATPRSVRGELLSLAAGFALGWLARGASGR